MKFLKKLYKFFTVYRLPYEVKPPYTHIVQAGDPILRSESLTVNKDDIKKPQIQQLINHLKKAIVKYEFVGLSACQVGVPLRIMALHFPQSAIEKLFTPVQIQKKQIQVVPLQVWINPEIKVEDYKTITDTEQCGSILTISAEVNRYSKIKLTGYDEHGKSKSLIAQGFTARIIQHEIDHLQGVLYTDKMNPRSLKSTLWDKVNEYNGYIEIRYYPKI